jgi:hypothetical protein
MLTFAIKSRISESVLSCFPNTEFKIKNEIFEKKNAFETSTQVLHDYSITLLLRRLDKSLASFLVLIVCCFCLVVVGVLFFSWHCSTKKTKNEGFEKKTIGQ